MPRPRRSSQTSACQPYRKLGNTDTAARHPNRGSAPTVSGTYLAECFWPGVTRDAVEAANARVRKRAAALRRAGSSVRFLGSLLIPTDEVVFFQFAAGSSEEVLRASREAELPFDRVAASIWLEPGDLSPPEKAALADDD